MGYTFAGSPDLGVVGLAGIPVVAVTDRGSLVGTGNKLFDGVWVPISSLFRLRLSGIGSVILDSKDIDQVVSEGVAEFSSDSSASKIEFPYPGAGAVQIRANITGNLTVEML